MTAIIKEEHDDPGKVVEMYISKIVCCGREARDYRLGVHGSVGSGMFGASMRKDRGCRLAILRICGGPCGCSTSKLQFLKTTSSIRG